MSDVFEAVLRDHRPFFRQAAFGAAHDLELFAALAEPRTVPALAASLGVGAGRLRALVDVLVLEGALRRDGDAVARVGAPPPATPLPAAGWGQLAAVLRADRPLPTPPAPSAPAKARATATDPATDAATDTDTGEATARYHDHLLEIGAAPARELAEALVTPDVRRVLDVGCGAGAYAAACLAVRPTLAVTLVDTAPVLDRARAHLGPAAARATFVPGDVLDAPISDDADLALLVNVIHLHGPETCAAVVGRLAAALAPGGRLVVKDLAVADDRSGPAVALYFALNMAIYTEGGDVHAEPDVRSWLAAAGLEAVHRVSLGSSPGSLVLVAGRPIAPGSAEPA